MSQITVPAVLPMAAGTSTQSKMEFSKTLDEYISEAGKRDQSPKAWRNQEMVKEILVGEKTYKAVSLAFNISTERVRQIVLKYQKRMRTIINEETKIDNLNQYKQN